MNGNHYRNDQKTTTPQAIPRSTISKRIIGEFGQGSAGPLVIFLAGVHGNEPASEKALKQVLAQLQHEQRPFRGIMVAMIGNYAACGINHRYIDEDMNRTWTAERVAHLLAGIPDPIHNTHETIEQMELHQAIDFYASQWTPVREKRNGNNGNKENGVYLIDLHTTSAPSSPFIVITDTMSNRAFARQFHTPIILGLEEQIPGTILSYASQLGYTSIAFEAGQHDDPVSVVRHNALIWLVLAACGSISDNPHTIVLDAQELLVEASKETPVLLEFKDHYRIGVDEEFAMEPGYNNFDFIHKGTLLARNQFRKIHANFSGYVFMPLYQHLGRDGFFLINRIHPVWLTISAVLRYFRLERLLPLSPGIQKRGSVNELQIKRRFRFLYPLRLLHLLGYHITDESLDFTYIARRPEIPR